MDTADLLLHPLRLRIVQALYGRTLTTSQLCTRMPDVPKTTVYRHVGLLVDGGLLDVESEQRVRGAVERRYRLHQKRAVLDEDAVAAMTPEDHRRGFTAVVGSLLAEFNLYLDRDDTDPVADAVSYPQFSLWLSGDEMAELAEEVRSAIRSRMGNKPSPERTRRLLTMILFPAEGPAEHERP
ncbi:helix-turn-helix domain-containing protein [Streptomyces sp. XD-27]|uniref:helix-turn-helix domain-containing protein n=1 Tax=Streptomyces sp. XD-27 TaxID=3062779 RepID=UPI0026F4176B|nr:helix-turn-helix domain-containing protein [Streptomyces sp. XD-27]WKX70747.1 helix-turn-helix domain-containing protein [Streptomyces sp. XD-27]